MGPEGCLCQKYDLSFLLSFSFFFSFFFLSSSSSSSEVEVYKDFFFKEVICRGVSEFHEEKRGRESFSPS